MAEKSVGGIMVRMLMAAALLGAAPAALAQGAIPAPGTASAATIAANRAFAEGLPWDDTSEATLAARGFLGTRADPLIRNAAGEVVMDLSAYDFLAGPAPATANPSLWRHGTLLRQHGLFEVTAGIWQVRGFDLSVMTLIRGRTGWIIVDPLTTAEVAAAALALADEKLGKRPVKAVIYTHSHADHFGGVKGVVDEADVKAGRVAILAPEGFMHHAVSENLTAGPAMSRRATYQFGTTLPRGPAGQAGAGIGTGIAGGTLTLIAPTRVIARTGETATIDGVRFEFQVTPGTEAPAEMNFYLPDLKALCLAENANVTMHNILPPRGALVRDAKAWADYLTEAQRLYGERTDLMFASHGWPRWGRADVNDYIGLHRDAYKYLHDQTVRMMNAGLTGPEIAELIALPPPLAGKWFNRGYYGTMRHNSRAIYQRYLGWYDGNPANLDAWPPEEAGRRYVAAMGGPAAARKVAADALAAGDYRWAAEVASRIVFADATDTQAREMLARAFEQMGYQAEGMLWRNIYLTGAAEARKTPDRPAATTVAPDLLAALDSAQLFDLLAIRVNPALAAGKAATVDFVFPDRRERTRLTLRNSVLVIEPVAAAAPPAQATLTLPRPAFLGMLFGGVRPSKLMADGTLKVDGDQAALAALLGSLDPAAPGVAFAIATP